MPFRYEWKHEIAYLDLPVLRQRLSLLARPDAHAGPDGSYRVRSLYFDTLNDTALRQNIDGIGTREKFRLRFYDGDRSFIRIEKKIRRGNLTAKESVRITCEETERLLRGETDWMAGSGRDLVAEFGFCIRSRGLRPCTVVDYRRIPFVYDPGSVRITLDTDIRTGLHRIDFLNPGLLTIPAGEPAVILEVKWDTFLPDVLRSALQLGGPQRSAYSKYRTCRIYD